MHTSATKAKPVSKRNEIIAAIDEIPAMPAAATNVLTLIQDPETSIAQIMDVIRFDPLLTAEILRLANSAYFTSTRRIENLNDAGVMFGSQKILQLVLISALSPLANQEIQGYDLKTGELMRHLLAVAIAAETLAHNHPVTPPTYVFTAGLLHDIGKIVLGTFLQIEADPIIELSFGQNISFEVAEKEILGIDHCEVGAMLLEKWQFPDSITQVVRWHRTPDRIQGDTHVVDLVHLADLLSTQGGLGIGVDGLNYTPANNVLDQLGFNQVQVEKVMASTITDLLSIESQFSQKSGGK